MSIFPGKINSVCRSNLIIKNKMIKEILLSIIVIILSIINIFLFLDNFQIINLIGALVGISVLAFQSWDNRNH